MKIDFVSSIRSSLVIVFVFAIGFAARASRLNLPMGKYISRAELIVIADTQGGNISQFESVLSVREVIKGDPKLTGQVITIRHSGWSTAGIYVPPNTPGLAILLAPGWSQATNSALLEVYRKPEQIQALRMLVPICAIEKERDRLLALRATLTNRNAICEQELFAQLRDMRTPTNFDLLSNLYPSFDLANQIKLVELVGEIGDVRGVPTLLVALASPDPKLSRTAADKLRYNFPGADGVTLAFEGALRREHLARVAAQYLGRYNSDPKIAAVAEGGGTPWLRATRLLESGKKAEGRAAYLEIVRNENENYRIRLHAAATLLNDASSVEKDRIRKALVPAVAHEQNTNDYLVALQVAEIMRAFQHEDCIPALLGVLRFNSFVSSKATWTAAVAVRELGLAATQTAVAQIVESMKSAPPKSVLGQNALRYPLELLWIGTQKNFVEAEPLMEPQHAAAWKSLRPLQSRGAQQDELSFLIEQLSRPAEFPKEAKEWILFQLGDSKNPHAIPSLMDCFASDPDWRITQAAADALVAIGGHDAEEALLKLARHPDENRVRRHAMDALFKISGDTRAIAKRVLAEKDFGWKPSAYLALGRVGTSDDLQLLTNLADFWTGDRTNHYWAMTALSSVRDRCNYDLSGPIQSRP